MRKTVAAALVLALAWGVAGCRRKPPPPPVPPAQTQAPETPEQAAQAAKAVVTAYLSHLEQGEYKAAHDLLSPESQKQHPFEEFAEQAKKGGPLYETQQASAKATGEGRAVVSVPMVEDPARVSLTAAKEGEAWRVVYRTGRPWTPYP